MNQTRGKPKNPDPSALRAQRLAAIYNHKAEMRAKRQALISDELRVMRWRWEHVLYRPMDRLS